MISDMNYGTIVRRVRMAVPRDYARIKRLPRKAQEMLMQKAMAALATFPPELQQAAKQIIDRETSRGVPYSGLGWVDIATGVATAVATVGELGLSVYSIQEQKKLQSKADQRADLNQQMNNLMLLDQMKTTAMNRELQRKQVEQQMSAQQSEIEAMQRMSQQPATVPGMTPGTAPTKNNTKTLLIAGGAAVAAIAAVALMK